MGGRGTYSNGFSPQYQYETVGKIEGVKVLQPKDKSKNLKLPEESHTAENAYVLLDRNGVFHQYREYNSNHEVVLEIGYHHEKSLGDGDVLHIHIHKLPGIDYHNDITTEKRKLTIAEYRHYKKFFKGVTVNEREYFGRVH